MSRCHDALHPPSRAQVLVRPVDRRQPRPRSVRRRRARRRCRRSTPWRCSAEVGAWGVNLHDNDLVPIDATPAERDRIVKEFKAACDAARHRRADGDRQPVLRPGVPGRRLHRQRRRACAPTRCRRRCARWTSAPSSARRSSCCGAAARAPRPMPAAAPDEAVKRLREAVNYLCEYSIDRRLRVQVRARGQAERAARRHLHGDDRQLPRASSRRSSTRRWSA